MGRIASVAAAALLALSCSGDRSGAELLAAPIEAAPPGGPPPGRELPPGPLMPLERPTDDGVIAGNAQRMLDEGRRIFRYDTFGSEAFWGDTLQLHLAVAGEKNGGVGLGLAPAEALAVGLKVDVDALPGHIVEALANGQVDLRDPAVTISLIKANAVVGVVGVTDGLGNVTGMGLTCAVCHSTVDDSFAPGIGKRRDGWPNRDLNVGAIVSMAPNPKPLTDLLRVDLETLKAVLASWGPGCYDAELNQDGKALRPDGQRACTLLPPAYGMAGVNLATYTGFGSVPYWNAYVGATQLHGLGTFWDPRLNNPQQYPVAARTGSWNVRPKDDRVTSKLAALHFYQLAIPAPKAPAGSFDAALAARGKDVFEGKARCAGCHVPPLFTEPGHNLHSPAEIGIDSFQADRSPTRMYRTTPLAGAWSRAKGGYYHDGRFATLDAVVDHYDRHLRLRLDEREKQELVEYVKSL